MHRHRRGHGFESHSTQNFFRLSFRNCLSCMNDNFFCEGLFFKKIRTGCHIWISLCKKHHATWIILSVILLKEGTYFCYCAYVLRILRYSGFLWVLLTNTWIVLHGLKLCRERRTWKVLLVFKKKIGGNHEFFRHKALI